MDLAFSPLAGEAGLGSQRIGAVAGLDAAFDLEIVLHDDLIDVCIAGQRMLVDRCPTLRGDALYLYAGCGAVDFEGITVYA